ncbi:MAG: hypothetical protein P8Z80_10720 [Pseudolabrys sp.]
MTEQLTITGIGHRGDGVAATPAGTVYVPYTLPGETATVEPVAGHPDRRHLLHIDTPSREAGRDRAARVIDRRPRRWPPSRGTACPARHP